MMATARVGAARKTRRSIVSRRIVPISVLGALAAAAMAFAPTTALAQYGGGNDHDRGGGHGAWHDHGGGYARGGFGGRDGYGYGRPYGGGYAGPRDRRGYPQGYERRRCRGGAGGAIIGAIAGGLLGHAMAGYGDRTAGTIIGGGAGAVAGSAIGRDC